MLSLFSSSRLCLAGAVSHILQIRDLGLSGVNDRSRMCQPVREAARIGMPVQVTQRQIESVCLNLGKLRGNHDNLLSHVLRSNFFQRKKSKIGLITRSVLASRKSQNKHRKNKAFAHMG